MPLVLWCRARLCRRRYTAERPDKRAHHAAAPTNRGRRHHRRLVQGSRRQFVIVIRVLPAVLTVRACVDAAAWRRQPETAISSLMQWLTLIKARVADCCEKMKKTAPTTLETLYSKASETLHLHEHPDRCADGIGSAWSVELGFLRPVPCRGLPVR